MGSPAPAVASLLMSPEKIVQLKELCELLGKSRPIAWKYTKRPDFPKPIAHLSTGRVWERRQVEAWAAKTLPLPPGKPPTPKKTRRNT
jgi:predicted DNA-binding transcriptional regulator AlpA